MADATINTFKISAVINRTQTIAHVLQFGNPPISVSRLVDHYQYQIPSAENSGITRTFAGKAIGLKIEVFILNAPLLQGADFTAAYAGDNTVITLAEDPFGTPAVYANYWIE